MPRLFGMQLRCVVEPVARDEILESTEGDEVHMLVQLAVPPCTLQAGLGLLPLKVNCSSRYC